MDELACRCLKVRVNQNKWSISQGSYTFLRTKVLSHLSPSDQRNKIEYCPTSLATGFKCLMLHDLILCGFLHLTAAFPRPGLGGVCSPGIKECTYTPRLKSM